MATAATTLPEPAELLAGMLRDALMLVREGRAEAADVDTAIRLGAGYPDGPLAILAALPAGQRDSFGAVPAAASTPVPYTTVPDTGAPAWTGPIGVAGTGTMAGGIAEAIARSGRPVLVLCRSQASYQAMMMRVAHSLARSVEKGRFSAADSDRYLANIAMANDASQLAECSLVIEAIKESLAAKRATFALLHAALPTNLPIATNTSSLRVADIADAAPGRAVFAMHFFNPAQAMKLVELVFPPDFPPALRDAAAGFARTIGKTAVTCADYRGFLVNRLLIPFLNDAARACPDQPEAIDQMMVERMGHPMGPFALMDMIGLDVMVLALESMAETEHDPRIVPADRLRDLVAAGHFGRKSGRGFHAYGTAR